MEVLRRPKACHLPEAIKIRLSAEDKAIFTEAGLAEGLSVSAWARNRLKGLARREAMERRLADREAAVSAVSVP
jgi:hypothetical protein